MTDWSYYKKFETVNDKYLPSIGQGETKATQICTAVNKLIYKWYNDGDVYDNTYYLGGWLNDLSSYANWLAKYADCESILNEICYCWNDSQYEDVLVKLADKCLDAEYLEYMDKEPLVGNIYSCSGKYRFAEYNEDDEEEYF